MKPAVISYSVYLAILIFLQLTITVAAKIIELKKTLRNRTEYLFQYLKSKQYLTCLSETKITSNHIFEGTTLMHGPLSFKK